MMICSQKDSEARLALSSGGLLSVLDPKADQIQLGDIATGLANACRYGGQLRDRLFLSVAEHSCLMTQKAVDSGVARSMEDALKVLLHDASEAYIGDIPTPLKRLLPDFAKIERRLQSCIEDAFGLRANDVGISKEAIKELDNRIRLDEIARATNDPARTYGMKEVWGLDPTLQPLGVKIRCLERLDAFDEFIDTFIWVSELEPREPQSRHSLSRFIDEARTIRDQQLDPQYA